MAACSWVSTVVEETARGCVRKGLDGLFRETPPMHSRLGLSSDKSNDGSGSESLSLENIQHSKPLPRFVRHVQEQA
jgi:hypothetical protein